MVSDESLRLLIQGRRATRLPLATFYRAFSANFFRSFYPR